MHFLYVRRLSRRQHVRQTAAQSCRRDAALGQPRFLRHGPAWPLQQLGFTGWSRFSCRLWRLPSGVASSTRRRHLPCRTVTIRTKTEITPGCGTAAKRVGEDAAHAGVRGRHPQDRPPALGGAKHGVAMSRTGCPLLQKRVGKPSALTRLCYAKLVHIRYGTA